MLRTARWGALVMLLASVALAQNVEPPKQVANKDAKTPGGATSGTAGAADKSTTANKSESPGPLAPSSVKCAIVPPVSGEQSVSAKEWLNPAKECRNSPEDSSSKNPTVGLNDRLFLVVTLSGGQLTAADKMPSKLDDLRLSINGIGIEDGKLTWEANDDNTAVLSAKLKRTATSKAAWNELLAQRLREHTVPVTVSDGGKKPLPSEAYFNLQVIQPRWYGFILLAILLALLTLLFTRHRLGDMLRDDGEVKNRGNGNAKAAYSLSRVQMFYWFCLTIVCYALIWMITGDLDTINNDVLTLMGISAGTFLGAVSIDSGKKAQAQSDLPVAAAKLQQTQAVEQAIRAAAAQGAADQATAEVAHAAVTSQQKVLTQLNDRTLADYSEGFLTDILSDEDGISFHRFQIFAWSLVLGLIFIVSVVQTLGMPAFGSTLLGLMGISSGTYLGFKFPEQKTK